MLPRLVPRCGTAEAAAARMLMCWCAAVSVVAMAAGAPAQLPPDGVDVVVYGATPGGVSAAVAAAREGRSVALLEPGLYTGGCMSGGLGQADYGMHAERVIGGISEEFFRRIAAAYNVSFSFPPDGQCGAHSVPWVSEPHVAENIFSNMLREAGVTVAHGTRISAVRLTPPSATRQNGAPALRIASVDTADGGSVRAKVFVDGTYAGALMKLAGVTYTFGREANTTYNETTAGRLPGPDVKLWPYGDRTAQLPGGISPWVDGTNTTLIAGVWGGDVAPPGGADGRVGSYDWRLTVTDDPSNSVPIPEPEAYDPAEFELLRRAIKAGMGFHGPGFNVPNRKSDWKMFGTFGEHPNAQWAYPNGTWEEQQAVVAEFKRYALSLLHFFRVDPAVPPQLRAEIGKIGLCADEYNRSGHWPGQLYVRTALRLVGRTVLTQADVTRTEWVDRDDAVGVASYTVDIPGPVQTIVADGEVYNEGSLKVPYFCDPAMAPFALPYSAMLPREGEADNLLVPVAMSASHIAFNTIRMEPTWMVLGQSAGVAAAMAASSGAVPPGGVGAVNVSALRVRLRALGQVLEPRPASPPAPTPPGLTGDAWFAWKNMWRVEEGAAEASGRLNGSRRSNGVVIVATEDGSVLKRSFASSHSLPPAEVRNFRKGAVVALKAPPTNASDSTYWLVHAANATAAG